METNSGFLENAAVPLVPGLNCIIGARGTCKSTFVESLRFALDYSSTRAREIIAADAVIPATLGAGSVRCFLEVYTDQGVDRYTVDRELGVGARVSYSNDGSSAIERAVGDVEIYSQGALQKIARADAPNLRLELIDRPNRGSIAQKISGIQEAAQDLRSLGERLRALRFEIEKRQLQGRDLPQVLADLGHTVDRRPVVSPELQAEHQAYLKRRRSMELFAELAGLQHSTANDLHSVSEALERLRDLRRRAASDAMEPAIEAQCVALEVLLETLEKDVEAFRAVDVISERQRLHATYDTQDQTYLALRQAAQEATESLKREDVLRQRLAELEKAERDLVTLVEERDAIVQRRALHRDNLGRLRDDIFDLRISETDRINHDFSDVVVLTMRRATQSDEYVSRLGNLLGGSRIRGQEDIARELALHFGYAELLELIEKGDAVTISEALGRDLGQITRAVSFLRDHPDLYELESASSEDTLDITMFDQGEPKRVEDLSEGQRATALLPLILRQSDCPLVIDQPEDDLDNSFIFEVLVRRLLDLKPTRQLILVTHNANIPVLGDAERVVVMHMASASKAAPPIVGTVDERAEDIIHLLEGGREAFEMREARYSKHAQ